MPEVQASHTTTVRDSLSRTVAVDLTARIGYLVSRFFIPPFVLAHVSLAAYGLWATAFIVVSYIGISTLGVSNVYIKYVAQYSARRDYDKANSLLSTGLAITLPSCALIFAFLVMAWPHVVQWLHISPDLQGDAREVVLTVAAIFLASISLSAFRDVLVGVQRSATVQSIWTIGYLLEAALIFFLVSRGRGIRGMAEAFLVRTSVEIALQMFIAFRQLSWLRISPKLISRQSVHTLFSFGAIVQIQSLLAIFLNSVERAVAAPLVGLEATGLLDIGQKLPAMAASVPNAFASSFVPAASYLHGGLDGTPEQREAVRKLYLKGARYMNLTAAYICGFLAALPHPILGVWMGKQYPGAAYLMVIFAIATQVHLMTGPGTSILKGTGRPREEFFYSLPNLLALVILLPAARMFEGRWTALGIGTAVPLATIVAAAIFIWHANRLLEVGLEQYWKSVIRPGMLPYLIGLALTFPVTRLVSQGTRWENAGWIILAGIVYSVVFAVVVDRFIWETGERLWFHALIRSKLKIGSVRHAPSANPSR